MELGGLRFLSLTNSCSSCSHIHFHRSHPLRLFSTVPKKSSDNLSVLPPKFYRPKGHFFTFQKFSSRYFCTTAEIGGNDCGGSVSENILNVVLVSPQIAGNTGSIARTCAATAVSLHLVEPLGFMVDDTKLKRAGLDYWPFVVVKIHRSWSEFRDYFCQQDGNKRLLGFTKRGTETHSEFSYKRGDWLVFGSETSGLPPEALLDCNSESLGGGTIRIPMVETYVRCLNLSVSVGIALYEASRQLNYEQIQNPPQPLDSGDQRLFISEDMFA